MRAPTLATVVTDARILLVCGTGGVGKTTTSVLLGLMAAQRGRRVLVLTVDPARRLANALGLAAFDHAIHAVWRQPNGPGALDGMMLDAKQTFDRIVERYAPTADSARAILHNPLYQQLSSTIAGSQEYMAMEQLYAVVESTAYDLILLDTPPTHQALDFFRAPLRMVDALTGSMLKLFLKPTVTAGKWGAALLARGTNTLLRVFGRLTGAELLHEISELMLSTVSLLGGFEERARAVHALLRRPDAGIILVTIPDAARIPDARHFLREARRLGMAIRGVMFNRTTPDFGAFPDLAQAPTALRDSLHPLYALAEQYALRRQQEQRLRASVVPRGMAGLAFHMMPDCATPPTTLDTLLTMAETIHSA